MSTVGMAGSFSVSMPAMVEARRAIVEIDNRYSYY
jgi:hypothetical protein